MKQTFCDRLKLLMKDEKPYTWARKVGIEKGLFQYYWQKGKIPTYSNLLKIQTYTGCSLDWLLTGKSIAVDQIDNLPMIREKSPVYGNLVMRRIEAVENVKQIFDAKELDDIELLEGVVGKILDSQIKSSMVGSRAK